MCQLSRKYRQSISCGNHITCLSNLCKLERCGIQICIPKLVNQQKEWLRDEFLEGVLSLILRQGCTQKASIASHTRRKISMTCKVKHFGSHYLSQNNVQETGMAALLYKEIIVIHNQEVKRKIQVWYTIEKILLYFPKSLYNYLLTLGIFTQVPHPPISCIIYFLLLQFECFTSIFV